MNLTVSEWYSKLKKDFEAAGIPEPESNALLLLEHFLNVTRHDLLIRGEESPDPEKEKTLVEAVKRRLSREPLQYITGNACFMGLDFSVDRRVLIPRPDTEILVEEALRELNDGSRILDVCTGSGCILISLLKYSNDCIGIGSDISEDALEVARKNASDILGNGNRAEFIHSDLFDAVEGKFEMIVSNPPYIPTDIVKTLMPEVKDFEPMRALDGTESGLYFYEKIIPEAKNYLTVGGQLLLEIGYDQGEAVENIMKKEGYIETKIIKDYAGLDRVVTGIKSVYL